MASRNEHGFSLSWFGWLSASLAVVYWLAVLTLPEELVVVVSDGMLASISMAVVMVFVPGVLVLLREGVKDGRMLIRLGIIASWGCTCVLSLQRIAAHEFDLFGTLDATALHPMRGFIAVMFMVAAALHITAIGAIERQTPRFNVCVVAWSLSVGMVSTATIYLARHGLA